MLAAAFAYINAINASVAGKAGVAAACAGFAAFGADTARAFLAQITVIAQTSQPVHFFTAACARVFAIITSAAVIADIFTFKAAFAAFGADAVRNIQCICRSLRRFQSILCSARRSFRRYPRSQCSSRKGRCRRIQSRRSPQPGRYRRNIQRTRRNRRNFGALAAVLAAVAANAAQSTQ